MFLTLVCIAVILATQRIILIVGVDVKWQITIYCTCIKMTFISEAENAIQINLQCAHFRKKIKEKNRILENCTPKKKNNWVTHNARRRHTPNKSKPDGIVQIAK